MKFCSQLVLFSSFWGALKNELGWSCDGTEVAFISVNVNETTLVSYWPVVKNVTGQPLKQDSSCIDSPNKRAFFTSVLPLRNDTELPSAGPHLI